MQQQSKFVAGGSGGNQDNFNTEKGKIRYLRDSRRFIN
jgi:hypothetical protein